MKMTKKKMMKKKMMKKKMMKKKIIIMMMTMMVMMMMMMKREGHLSNNCFQSFLHTASHRHLHFQHNNNNQRLDEIGTTTMCVWLGNQV